MIITLILEGNTLDAGEIRDLMDSHYNSSLPEAKDVAIQREQMKGWVDPGAGKPTGSSYNEIEADGARAGSGRTAGNGVTVDTGTGEIRIVIHPRTAKELGLEEIPDPADVPAREVDLPTTAPDVADDDPAWQGEPDPRDMPGPVNQQKVDEFKAHIQRLIEENQP